MKRTVCLLLTVLVSCIPAFAQTPSEWKGYIAHFANGEGLSFELIIVNPYPVSVAPNFRVIGEDGLPVDIGSTAVIASIPPYATFVLRSNGTGTLKTGYIEVTSREELGLSLRYSLPGLGVAAVPDSDPVVSATIPITEPLNSAIGVAGIGAESFTAELRNDRGQTIASRTISLRNGHTALFLTDMFGGLGSFKEGSLVLRAVRGKIAVIGLEVGATPGTFTVIPTTASSPE